MTKFFIHSITPKDASTFDVMIKCSMSPTELADLVLKTNAQDNSLLPDFGNRGKQLPVEN